MRDLLFALQHADSAFPSGSFAFSNGFEALLAHGVALDAAGLSRSLHCVLRHRWATSDRVALIHAHRCDGDLAAAIRIDQEVEAMSLCEPLRRGSRRNGSAFVTAHARIGTPLAPELHRAIRAGATPGHLPVAQGFLWRLIGLDERTAVAVSGYVTVAGLVTAAIRLGEIGAVAAQAVLAAALGLVAELAEGATEASEPMASFVPFIEIASARHAGADARLFAT